MRKAQMRFITLVLVALFVLAGCMRASIEPNQLASYKKIGFVLWADDTRPVELPSAKKSIIIVGSKEALIASAVLYVASGLITLNSLSSSLDEIKKKVPTYPIGELLEKSIAERISKRFEVTTPKDLSANASMTTPKGDETLSHLMAEAKAKNIDLLLVIKYRYGLKLNEGESSFVAIDSDVTSYDVKLGKDVLKNHISSGRYFREPRSLQEYVANDCDLFKRDIEYAANVFSSQVASQLGIDKDVLRNSPYQIALHYNKNCVSIFGKDCNDIKQVEIGIDNCYMNIGASQDGKNLFMTQCVSAIDNVNTLANPRNFDINFLPNNICLNLVKKRLAEHGIEVMRTIRLLNGDGIVYGYYLQLNGDGYQVLKPKGKQ